MPFTIRSFLLCCLFFAASSCAKGQDTRLQQSGSDGGFVAGDLAFSGSRGMFALNRTILKGGNYELTVNFGSAIALGYAASDDGRMVITGE